MSVDWDYFTPSASAFWTWVSEAPDNFVKVWKYRDTSNIKVEPYLDFWKWLSKWFIISKNAEILVSESHLAVYNLLKPDHKLILFDSHHDCYNNSTLDCGSWGTHWLMNNDCAETIWLSQVSEIDLRYLKGIIKRNVRSQISAIEKEQTTNTLSKIYLSRGKRSRFDFIHVCRSACWTPPKFDGDFAKFLEASGCKIIYLPDDTKINPLVNRMAEIERIQIER